MLKVMKMICLNFRALACSLLSAILLGGVGLTAHADPACEAPPSGSQQVNYAYDALGRLVEVCYPDNEKVIYKYDAAGNRTEVESDGSSASKVQFIVVPLSGLTVLPIAKP